MRGVRVCVFCGAVGLMNRCAWPVEKETAIEASDLRIGDSIRVGSGPLDFRKIISVYRSHDGGTIFYTRSGSDRPFGLSSTPEFEAAIRGLRPAPCGTEGCNSCSCERADGVHHGRCHWDEWSKVA